MCRSWVSRESVMKKECVSRENTMWVVRTPCRSWVGRESVVRKECVDRKDTLTVVRTLSWSWVGHVYRSLVGRGRSCVGRESVVSRFWVVVQMNTRLWRMCRSWISWVLDVRDALSVMRDTLTVEDTLSFVSRSWVNRVSVVRKECASCKKECVVWVSVMSWSFIWQNDQHFFKGSPSYLLLCFTLWDT